MFIDRWMDTEDMLCNGTLLSHYNTLNNAICNNMAIPRDYTKWSMSDKDKYHMTLLMCITKKTATNELILQNRKRRTDWEN